MANRTPQGASRRTPCALRAIAHSPIPALLSILASNPSPIFFLVLQKDFLRRRLTGLDTGGLWVQGIFQACKRCFMLPGVHLWMSGFS